MFALEYEYVRETDTTIEVEIHRGPKHDKAIENGEADHKDLNGSGGPPRSSRIGLSEYTSQRLAELRARRAEAEKHDSKSSSSSSSSTATATASATSPTALSSEKTSSVTAPVMRSASAVSSGDYMDGYRARRGLSTAAASTDSGKYSHSTAGTTAAGAGVIGGSTTASSLSSKDYKSDYVASSRSSTDYVTGSALSRSSSCRVGSERDDECVGFASLPEQVHRKAIKRGFDFTVMVVGETGLGKSTLVSSLFLNDELYLERTIASLEDRVARTVQIEKKYMEIEERGVKLRLTIVDTPGFNDAVNSEMSWKPIEEYINQQFDQFYKDESGLNRKNIKDNRVHCCLYFISPYGHGLKQVDVQFMRRLHDKVNIVPIIAKADCLTPTELKKIKARVLAEIEEQGIKIYDFPACDSDEDEEFLTQDTEMKAAIPFAVIGSNAIVEVNGKKVRGRLYPWGIVEVDNPAHCDFLKLRQMLISTHMQDLKDVTRDIHYENFRARFIKEQLTRQQRERNKLKRDSSPNFENLMDTDNLLQQKDDEIRRMQDMLSKMKAQLEANTVKVKSQVNGIGSMT